MILVRATWIGLLPREAHHTAGADAVGGAREIGAGHLDRRLEPETARRVRVPRRRLQHAWPASSRPAARSWSSPPGSAAQARRSRKDAAATSKRCSSGVATGVISVDAGGPASPPSIASAARLLGARGRRRAAVPLAEVLGRGATSHRWPTCWRRSCERRAEPARTGDRADAGDPRDPPRRRGQRRCTAKRGSRGRRARRSTT